MQEKKKKTDTDHTSQFNKKNGNIPEPTYENQTDVQEKYDDVVEDLQLEGLPLQEDEEQRHLVLEAETEVREAVAEQEHEPQHGQAEHGRQPRHEVHGEAELDVDDRLVQVVLAQPGVAAVGEALQVRLRGHQARAVWALDRADLPG